MIFGVKILGLVVALIAHQLLGMLWYSPILFGNMWIKGIGKTPDDFKNKKGYAVGIILSSLGGLIAAFAIGYLACLLVIEHLWQAIVLAILVNAGFVVSNNLVHAPFEFKKPSVVLIGNGYDLVSYIVMAIILFYLR